MSISSSSLLETLHFLSLMLQVPDMVFAEHTYLKAATFQELDSHGNSLDSPIVGVKAHNLATSVSSFKIVLAQWLLLILSRNLLLGKL